MLPPVKQGLSAALQGASFPGIALPVLQGVLAQALARAWQGASGRAAAVVVCSTCVNGHTVFVRVAGHMQHC